MKEYKKISTTMKKATAYDDPVGEVSHLFPFILSGSY
jgi:hypothetical protein